MYNTSEESQTEVISETAVRTGPDVRGGMKNLHLKEDLRNLHLLQEHLKNLHLHQEQIQNLHLLQE